jgi:hypothetical protein
MRALNPIYALIGFIALLLLITPFSKVYQVNVLFTISLVAAASYAAGVWIVIALRDKGDTVIFMKDSVRKSKAMGVIAETGETSTGRLPGLSALPYGGFTATAVNVADKNLAVIPTSSIEQLSPSTTLVYAPTSPLKNARLLKSIMAFFAKTADVHSFLSFSTDRKSRSEVRFGFLNGLVTPITTEALMEQERMINSKGSLVDMLERAEGGEDSNQEELQRMIRTVKKQTPMEKAKSILFGARKTETQSDRPTQREPQG